MLGKKLNESIKNRHAQACKQLFGYRLVRYLKSKLYKKSDWKNQSL